MRRCCRELKAHVLQPQFQYWHDYRVGDAVLWDNWRSLHAASGTPGKYVRTLWSIVIDAGPEIGRPMPAGGRAEAMRMAVVNARSDEPLACRISRLYLEYVKAQDTAGLADLFPDGTELRRARRQASSAIPPTIAGGYDRGFKNMGKPWEFRLENVLPFGTNGCLLEFNHKTNEPWRHLQSFGGRPHRGERGRPDHPVPAVLRLLADPAGAREHQPAQVGSRGRARGVTSAAHILIRHAELVSASIPSRAPACVSGANLPTRRGAVEYLPEPTPCLSRAKPRITRRRSSWCRSRTA